MENLVQSNLEAHVLTNEQLVEQHLIYPVGAKPVFAATPVGMATDPSIRAVFERNFAPERQARIERCLGDAAPRPIADLLTNNLFHVDHRRGVLNADSCASSTNRGDIPAHLAGLEHYVRVGGAAPAGSLRYASEKGMPSIELTKVTLSGTAWQAARNATAMGMAAFSGVPGEWQTNGVVDKGPKMGVAAYGENGEILAVTVRARKDRGTTGGRWQVREMQSYIVRVDAESGINPEVTEALQLLAEPERSLEAMRERVHDINAASAADDTHALRRIAREIVGNGSAESIEQMARAAATVRGFVHMVHGEIERDTLELRDWAIPVTQTLYARDLWAPKPADIVTEQKLADRQLSKRLRSIVAKTDEQHARDNSEYWRTRVGRMAAEAILAEAS